MVRFILILAAGLLLINSTAFCQYILSGRVVDSLHKRPIEFAVIAIAGRGIQISADEKGNFTLKSVPAGKAIVAATYLGYKRKSLEIDIDHDITNLLFVLQEDNLTLDEVHITGEKTSDLSTSYLMDRKALDHMQMISVADATSLLPGGKTSTTLHLASSAPREISLNGSGSESGNHRFGVAVEVDGVRLSNNALSYIGGSDTRSIASSNVESIEVITGIPSVEYGDLTNGLVKISTRKGKTPFIVDLVTKPHTKQVALGKGFVLDNNGGVLNADIEYTRSISDIASPYTSYDRNSLSIKYSNVFNRQGNTPLTFEAGLSGNAGGFNNKFDPDLFVDTYRKANDGAIRGTISGKWLLNKKWITNLEVSGTLNYSDTKAESSANRSFTSSTPALHVTEEGYHVGELYDENPSAPFILIPPGLWYEVEVNDSRSINYSAKIKGNWSRRFGSLSNSITIGGSYDGSRNDGRGIYYQDPRFAPTSREYPLDQIPPVKDFAFFAEDNAGITLGRSTLQLVAGLRSDITNVKGSVYGTVGNLSPRFNIRYIFPERKDKLISNLSIKAGWGKTVKLPSMNILFDKPSYTDMRTFTPGTTDKGETFYAYYTMPGTMLYNPELKWQSNIQQEIGLNMTVRGTKIELVFSRDRTYNPYDSRNIYTPFTYNFTGELQLEGSLIPATNRIYSVDRNTGIVTVTDRTGALPPEILSYIERPTFKSNSMPINGSSVERRRLNWIISFKQISALRTSLNIDGSFYRYKAIDKVMKANSPAATTMADGNPYKYIGFYAGDASWSNGKLTKNIDLNLTITTHIPAIRMIFSARVEASLYDFSQNLSESDKGTRGFVLDSRNDYFPSASKTDIYGGDRYVGVYPEYYISLDDMNTPVPFAEKFAWAKENDPALYSELSKMVEKTSYSYSFNKSGTSPYYMVKFGVTKEIGRAVSLSFNATNFLNSTDLVSLRETNTEYSLFNSPTIPNFYYGLSLRLKW
ncbi:TonB-dependent receptor [Arcticibacter tournemirensis]|uniref:TonB-dependent receptor n=1 Tax=Arcticibacter tournemirensis TaxID=699437 RepID=A0A4Q0MH03_9SPHI|nr:carboxypeptidase-like regulatory domain-containing protein [Arcticibacter tournemirensis]RXF72279.1 TonB-dependent receptor [Arcticibacter tournemirensis]